MTGFDAVDSMVCNCRMKIIDAQGLMLSIRGDVVTLKKKCERYQAVADAAKSLSAVLHEMERREGQRLPQEVRALDATLAMLDTKIEEEVTL